MSVAARTPSDSDDDWLDMLLSEIDPDRPYRTSFRALYLHATDEFDRIEAQETSSVLYDEGIMCPTCIEEIRDDGIEEVLTSWHRKDPYCTVVTDLDEIPTQFRADKTTKQEEYVGILCPDHPDVFIAYTVDGYR